MTVLQAKDVREQLKNDAVKEIVISRAENDQYEVDFILTWAKAPAPFFTQRNTKRTWVSLDRLVAHIEALNEKIPPIKLLLQKGTLHHETDSEDDQPPQKPG